MKPARPFPFAVAALLLLAACARPPVPPHWYALRGDVPSPAAAVGAAAGDTVWALSPRVRLPGALERDTLVVENGAAGLQPLTGHRWAEPLRDGIPRLLLQDLATLRGSGRVWLAPAPPGVAAAERLTVEVMVLHVDAARRRLRLQARWWFEPAGAAAGLPCLGEADLNVAPAGDSVDALAAAHRLALWHLAQRIVASDPRRPACDGRAPPAP